MSYLEYDTSKLSAQPASTQEYLGRIGRIQKQPGDLQAVEKLNADINADWGKKKDSTYYFLVCELCRAVRSWPNVDVNAMTFIEKLIVDTIDGPGDKPIYSECRLLLLLQRDPDYAPGILAGREWEGQRLTRVSRWLAAWGRLRHEKMRLPAVIDMPSTNVMPPAEAKQLIYPGMEPAKIIDPILREKYLQAIAKNAAKARLFEAKVEIENTESMFVGPAKRYIINIYTTPPYNLEEMSFLLEKNNIDVETRREMIAEAKRRINEKIERDVETARLVAANTAIKPAKPFTEPRVGDSVTSDTLSSNPKLHVQISMSIAKPELGAMLDILDSKTGLIISVAKNIPRERVAFWSIGYHKVPAWRVMDDLKDALVERGSWVKTDMGYELKGDLKPPLKIKGNILETEEPPLTTSTLAWGLIVVLVVFGGIGVFYIRWFRTKRQ